MKAISILDFKKGNGEQMNVDSKVKQQPRFLCSECKHEIFLSMIYCDECGGEIKWPSKYKAILPERKEQDKND
jgi:hypothetical protein